MLDELRLDLLSSISFKSVIRKLFKTCICAGEERGGKCATSKIRQDFERSIMLEHMFSW